MSRKLFQSQRILSVSLCCGICSMTKQPPFCLDVYRELGDNGLVSDELNPSLAPLIPGQSGRKRVTEVTTSYASMLISCGDALLSLKTHRRQDLYFIIGTCCSLLCSCITSLGFGPSFYMVVTDTVQI